MTGAHRSGTTWVGKMLAASSDPVGYLREPFGVRHRAGVCAAGFPYWFPYVCAENEGQYLEHVAAMLRWEYQAGAQRRAGASTLPRAAVDWLRFRRHAARHAVPLVKDPIAVFSSEWLATRFGMRVVVLVRHPAAFAASLKRWGWRHPFGDFLAQPLLMRDLLGPYADEIRSFAARERDLVDQASLLWLLVYDVVSALRTRHPEWLIVRHEDLCRAPVEEFGRLYARLGLTCGARARRRVLQSTSPRNPEEARSAGDLRRDSARSVETWRRSLSPEEIRRVRKRTAEVAGRFYAEDDW